MNPILGWGLAFVAMVAGWLNYGWQGLAMVVSVIVFWLLLQFSRVLRVLKNAGAAPVGHVDNAVMVHARLAQGQNLGTVLGFTRSLGRRLDAATQGEETYRWEDPSSTVLEVSLENGRVLSWRLVRPTETFAPAAAPGPVDLPPS